MFIEGEECEFQADMCLLHDPNNINKLITAILIQILLIALDFIFLSYSTKC